MYKFLNQQYWCFQKLLIHEFHHLILWVPVLVGIGNLIYLFIPFEPSLNSVIINVSIAALSYILILIKVYNKDSDLYFNIKILTTALFIIILSFTNIKFQTEHLKADKIKYVINYTKLQGKIIDLILKEKGCKILLGDPLIEKRPHLNLKKIRISYLKCDQNILKNYAIGDLVELNARLHPVPQAYFKGIYDYRITAFFQQIGGVGYALSDMRIIKKSISDNNFIAKMRNFITLNFIEQLNKNTVGVAVALIIGETAHISLKNLEYMRNSGLAHMLAVSGMHISLVVGICFVICRYACVIFTPNLASFYNTKKFAAAVAIIISSVYLLLSGMHIAAQRAYIMCVLVMIAVIFYRSVTPMRLLCFAATIILLINPGVIIQPSFQMSFSAVLGLIGGYNYFTKLVKLKPFDNYLVNNIIFYPIGIIISSLIATLFTTFYSIYHFGNFAPLGIVANLLAIPILTFYLMPLLLIWLFLLPLGISAILKGLINKGIEAILDIAQYISSYSGTEFQNLYINPTSLIFITLGFIWLCFWQTSIKWMSLILFFIALIFHIKLSQPEIIIDIQNKNLVIKENNNLYVSNFNHLNNMYLQQLKRISKAKIIRPLPANYYNNLINCDSLGCLVNIGHDNKLEIAFDPIISSFSLESKSLILLNEVENFPKIFVKFLNHQINNSKILLIFDQKLRPWN